MPISWWFLPPAHPAWLKAKVRPRDTNTGHGDLDSADLVALTFAAGEELPARVRAILALTPEARRVALAAGTREFADRITDVSESPRVRLLAAKMQAELRVANAAHELQRIEDELTCLDAAEQQGDPADPSRATLPAPDASAEEGDRAR